jgi:uncharacterized protein YacL (UPF0231 family)
MDPKLRQKVEERIFKLDDDCRSGPVVFYYMMREIMSSTEKSLRAVKTQLENIKLKDVDGENVSILASWIRGATLYLKNNNSLPSDIFYIIKESLRACSTDQFVKYIDTIYTNHQLKLVTLDPDEFLDLAEAEYKTMLTAKQWAVFTKKKGSAFMASSNNKTIKCWKCGQEGHTRANCPNNTSSENTQPGQGQWARPEPGQPQKKMINGKLYQWCAKCKKWSQTHGTDGHQNETNNNNGGGQSNNRGRGGRFNRIVRGGRGGRGGGRFSNRQHHRQHHANNATANETSHQSIDRRVRFVDEYENSNENDSGNEASNDVMAYTGV